jgi:hypothetical protein
VLYLAPPVLRLFRYLDAVERGRRRRFGEVVGEQIVARVPVGNVDNVARLALRLYVLEQYHLHYVVPLLTAKAFYLSLLY